VHFILVVGVVMAKACNDGRVDCVEYAHLRTGWTISLECYLGYIFIHTSPAR
jgi:hypothetical protein